MGAEKCESCVCRWECEHLHACTWLHGEQYVSFLPLQLREAFESLADSPRSSGTGKGLDHRVPGREKIKDLESNLLTKRLKGKLVIVSSQRNVLVPVAMEVDEKKMH